MNEAKAVHRRGGCGAGVVAVTEGALHGQASLADLDVQQAIDRDLECDRSAASARHPDAMWHENLRQLTGGSAAGQKCWAAEQNEDAEPGQGTGPSRQDSKRPAVRVQDVSYSVESGRP